MSRTTAEVLAVLFLVVAMLIGTVMPMANDVADSLRDTTLRGQLAPED